MVDPNIDSSFVVVADRDPFNSLTVLPTIIDDDDPNDFSRLKVLIRSFLRDHPRVVEEIGNYFNDQLIEHILKRCFRVRFTVKDSAQTNLLYQGFFVEHDQNIRLIFDYFFDEIRRLILTGKCEEIPWPLRQTMIYTPKSILLRGMLTWLNYKGAEVFTRTLYQPLLNPVEEQSRPILFHHYLFVVSLILLLFAINIPIIGLMINCLVGIVLVLFLFYNSFVSISR